MTMPASPDDPAATERQLEGFIARFDPDGADRAWACRAALRARMPTANVLVYDNSNALAIGWVGAGRAGTVARSPASPPPRGRRSSHDRR